MPEDDLEDGAAWVERNGRQWAVALVNMRVRIWWNTLRDDYYDGLVTEFLAEVEVATP